MNRSQLAHEGKSEQNGPASVLGHFFRKTRVYCVIRKQNILNRKKEILVKCLTHAAKESIKEAANEKDDSLI